MNKILSIIILICFPLSIIKSQQPVYNFGNNHVHTSSISYTADGKVILIGGYAKFYDVALGKLDFRTVAKDSETQMDYSFEAIISPDNHTFILTKINHLEIWDMRSRKKIKTIRDNQLVPTAVCFSADGDIIIMRKNGELVIINSRSYNESLNRKLKLQTPKILALSPEGKKIFIGTKGNEIFSYELNTQQLTSITTDCQEIVNIQFSPAGDYIAASSSDGRIWLSRYPSMERVRSWQADSKGQTVIAFHPSGQYLASGGKIK